MNMLTRLRQLNEKKDAESQLASVREQRLRMSDKLEKNTQVSFFSDSISVWLCC